MSAWRVREACVPLQARLWAHGTTHLIATNACQLLKLVLRKHRRRKRRVRCTGSLLTLPIGLDVSLPKWASLVLAKAHCEAAALRALHDHVELAYHIEAGLLVQPLHQVVKLAPATKVGLSQWDWTRLDLAAEKH